MQLEFGNQFVKLIMDVFELAVTQFDDFGALSGLVDDLYHVGYFVVQVGLVMDDSGLQTHPST